MVHRAKASHIGSALSMIDILAVLYSGILDTQPGRDDRDRIIVSKGHAAVGLYAILAETGFFPVEELDSYGQPGSRLLGHVSHHVPGVEVSTGSLGHGMPIACGLALAIKQCVVCIVGDGELNEGTTWESALFAGKHSLTNLTVIVDHNRLQGYGDVDEILGLGSISKKFAQFGWSTVEIDGHNHDQIRNALATNQTRPNLIIAHTVKGKGVDFMEGSLDWHYKSPNTEELANACRQLEAA